MAEVKVQLHLVTEGASYLYGCGPRSLLDEVVGRYRRAGFLAPDSQRDHVYAPCCTDPADPGDGDCALLYQDTDSRRHCLLGAYSLAVLEGRYLVAAQVAIEMADSFRMMPALPEAVRAVVDVLRGR